MAVHPAANSFPIPDLKNYPGNEVKRIFANPGTLSGTVLNYSSGGLAFVIDQAVEKYILEYLDVCTDGLSNAYGNAVVVTAYKVPDSVTIQAAIYLGDTYKVGEGTINYATATANPNRLAMNLSRYTDATRRFNRGDRLVVVFRSVADSGTTGYYSTQLSNVTVAGAGRTLTN